VFVVIPSRLLLNNYYQQQKERIMTKEELKKLWSDLGDIPVNEDDETEEKFLHFDIGTDKLDIWHWFDDEYAKHGTCLGAEC
jgi:hypothetical protein